MKASERFWADGSLLVAVLLDRFAPGQTVTISRTEAMHYKSSRPVVFALSADGATMTLKIDDKERQSPETP